MTQRRFVVLRIAGDLVAGKWNPISSIGRMDRPILFMYANRFKGIETGF